jgi:hypothetical protein
MPTVRTGSLPSDWHGDVNVPPRHQAQGCASHQDWLANGAECPVKAKLRVYLFCACLEFALAR